MISPSEVRVKIAPSVLAADFGRLGEQVSEADEAGADYIHIDIMDGQFVPALTFGAQMIGALRTWSEVPFDVHMMVEDPVRYVPDLVKAGADIITIHAEACDNLDMLLKRIKESGVRVGVALKPSTPVSAVESVLKDLDLILIMTVEPGLGGQPFLVDVVEKITRVRSILDHNGFDAELEVDGGISPQTAMTAVNAGARVLVAGSAIFSKDQSVADAIKMMRKASKVTR
jgi:ribulose-phosphate 3-epimerase